MKRVTAGAHRPTSWLFLSLRNAQTIEPTTAWTAAFQPTASTRYSFLQLCVLGRALWAYSGEGSAQRAFPANYGPPSSEDKLHA